MLGSVSFYQPWLRLDETSVEPFSTLVALMPPTLRVTSFSGDVNIVGNITLTPSPTGTLDIAAAGAINALQISGVTTVNGVATNNWTPSTINVSDADPNALAGIASPLAYQTFVGTAPIAHSTGSGFLTSIDNLFEESGSTEGVHAVLQNKQSLHAPGILHRDDPDPLHLYAKTGSISGLTLFSPKSARIFAGEDITDIAFYLQNVNASDFSIVAAGRDLVAYDLNSPFRVMANSIRQRCPAWRTAGGRHSNQRARRARSPGRPQSGSRRWSQQSRWHRASESRASATRAILLCRSPART